MSTTVTAPAAEVERPQLRSPEKVLSTIAATARLSGIAAPRRITFDEPEPGRPLAVLAMSWPSMDAMRPWLSFFHIDPHKPDATTVYGDYHGWSLMLNAPDPETTCLSCGGEMTHRAGCPSEPEHLADHYAADPDDGPCCQWANGDGTYCHAPVDDDSETCEAHHAMAARWPECIDCTVPGGSHQESCAFASRVDPEAAAAIPVVVLNVTPNPAPSPDIDDTIARLFDDDARMAVDELDDLPAVSVAQLAEVATVEPDAPIDVLPVTHFLAESGNTEYNCGAGGGAASMRPFEVDCPDCLAVMDLPKRIPGTALAAEPVPALDEKTMEFPALHHVPLGVGLLRNGHEVPEVHDHEVPIVDVLTVDPELDADERSGAEMARLNGATS